VAARREALSVFVWSRAAVWVGALFALFTFLPNGDPYAIHRDDPTIIHDLGRLTDVWARWDSVWFIRIAHHGYGVAPGAPAFYPLYPALVAAAGRICGGHYVLGGLIVSLLAGAGTFVLLHRLAGLLAGPEAARRSVLFLAVFPMSLFLQAVYSESVFLLVAVAAFLAAERARFAAAGILTGLALLARPTGVAVLVGVLVLALQSQRRLRDVAATVVPALGLFLLFPLTLWFEGRNPLAFLHVERLWYRHTARLGPVGGLVDAARAVKTSVLQLAVGSSSHPYGPRVGADHFAALNLEATAFFVVAVALGIVAWRRLGAAYGLMVLVAVVAPVATPAVDQPLLSMPRFTLVAFPIFIALAAVCTSVRAERVVVGVGAVLLGVATMQWALWQFVS
jgi:4-amino-4-deoxy-L-arabinose transferase-like glycosyltransferase